MDARDILADRIILNGAVVVSNVNIVPDGEIKKAILENNFLLNTQDTLEEYLLMHEQYELLAQLQENDDLHDRPDSYEIAYVRNFLVAINQISGKNL